MTAKPPDKGAQSKDPYNYPFQEFVSRILRVPKKAVDNLKTKGKQRRRSLGNAGKTKTKGSHGSHAGG